MMKEGLELIQEAINDCLYDARSDEEHGATTENNLALLRDEIMELLTPAGLDKEDKEG
jgi:hypothetical protein